VCVVCVCVRVCECTQLQVHVWDLELYHIFEEV